MGGGEWGTTLITVGINVLIMIVNLAVDAIWKGGITESS